MSKNHFRKIICTENETKRLELNSLSNLYFADVWNVVSYNINHADKKTATLNNRSIKVACKIEACTQLIKIYCQISNYFSANDRFCFLYGSKKDNSIV